MKIAILITTYNRPAYLKRCLDSLKRVNLQGAEIVIMDDASDDEQVKELIKPYLKIIKHKREGICDSLLRGLSVAFFEGADIVISLDADAIVRNDFLQVLLKLHNQFPGKIITGFHSTTMGRHEIISTGEGYAEKKSVGGINMLFTKQTWERYAKPALEKCIVQPDNWDNNTCKLAGSVICAVPSVVQHIGIESSLGHHDNPDVADDFKMLSLPNVTLVCVDDDAKRTNDAVHHSMKSISFGRIKMLSHFSGGYVRSIDDEQELINIPLLGSKEAYSFFILKELYKYIGTDYVLIIQHDGHVKNADAWTDEFLNYDYIGAPWWYQDGMNVGNGGFSLRSKKLMQFVSALSMPVTHPEDHAICRLHRKEIEAAGFKFAPDEVANKFSFEGYNQPGTYTNQFGFHGSRAFKTPPHPNKEGFIINQFLGLGDILFLVPLIRKWMAAGHDIIWPIADEYINIKQHFPDIQFVAKSLFPMLYENRIEFMHSFRWGRYRVKPLRWNMCRSAQDAMTSKYDMAGEDWKMWRSLSWERDLNKERKLADIVGASGEYELACEGFGNITDGGATSRKVGTSGLHRIELRRVEGFTLLDWSGIIENATAIHAVSSSTLYLFEILKLRCSEINLYARKLGTRDFEYMERLLTKKYNLHL